MANINHANQSTGDFEDFFRAELRKLIGFLRHLGASPEVAEEAAADAMIALHDQWETVINPRAFVKFVARRRFLTQHDKITRRGEQGLGDVDVADPRAHTEGIVEANCVDPRLVLDVLCTLSPEQRTVMALMTDGYTNREIAVVLGMNSSTVRSNLRHARTKLRRAIELEHAAGEEDAQWTSTMPR